jgi:hypothetical protein
MKASHQLLQALVACSLASVALPAAASDAADAVDHWVVWRLANGLPVNPQPSQPGELPTFAGPVPDTLREPLPDANGSGNGDGNGNGSSHCDSAFMVELARTDGDTLGESGICR